MRFSAEQAKHANYACAALSLIILLTRIAISLRRKRQIGLSFFLVILSIIVIIARILVVYFYLLYGTGSDALRDAGYFNEHNADTIKKGSILSLVARVLITASCWLQVCLLLLFYKGIMQGIQWVSRMINLTWAATAITFVAVVLVTLLECRPIRLYWQVEPDPGSCVKGYAQLLLQCTTNIVLDLLLLAISYPILICKGRDWKQHLRVGTLFVLGTFCIIVTSLRLASVYDTSSAQPTRSLWASVQMLTSTFVANAPTIYGDLKNARRKKSEAVARRKTLPEIWRRDTEAGQPDMPLPARIATRSSMQSRKEWFDHLEDIDDIR